MTIESEKRTTLNRTNRTNRNYENDDLDRDNYAKDNPIKYKSRNNCSKKQKTDYEKEVIMER